jgi:Holliday junction resolvasome RuvABC endonuclease subunit
MVIMTKQLVSVRDDAKYDDEYDAVAVGITCLAHEG